MENDYIDIQKKHIGLDSTNLMVLLIFNLIRINGSIITQVCIL